MNPDVAKAIPDLVARGILEGTKAVRLLRIARGELISVQPEIRLLFYFGVLLTTAGAGILFGQSYRQIGPLTVAVGVGIGALAIFAWTVRRAPAFSWNEAASPSLSHDYLLLLAVLLASADLAFIEVQFTPLGPHWPYHLLATSLLMAAIAVRYDSRTIFSLALATFAAWRGLSVSFVEKNIWRGFDESVLWNALLCGLLFVYLGHFLRRTGRKPHFEPVAVHAGWLLILGALTAGGAIEGSKGLLYIGALAAAGAGLALRHYRKRRFSLFSFGVLAVYLSLFECIVRSEVDFVIQSLLVSGTAVAWIVLLRKARRRMKESL
jgi:hypothetical protein